MQILVVVANIQMRTLKTEVEKGSMRTAFGHGLVGPKDREILVRKSLFSSSKGNRVNIPELGCGYCVVTQINLRSQW